MSANFNRTLGLPKSHTFSVTQNAALYDAVVHANDTRYQTPMQQHTH